MQDERGFTLVEFMIAAAIMAAVLGGTVLLATQLQQVYSTQLDDTTVEEELRFSLDWIAQALRNAGSNPYDIGGFTGIVMAANSISLRADINPPDGALDDENEDVTIALDAARLVITRQDNSTGGAVVDMTEPIISNLEFIYLNSARAVTTIPDQIAYVRVRVTGRSLAYNSLLGDNTQTTLETEVRVRTR